MALAAVAEPAVSLLRDIENVLDLFNHVARALESGDGLGTRDHAGEAIAHFEEWTSLDPDKKQLHSDSGTFRSQVKRLFALAKVREREAFEEGMQPEVPEPDERKQAAGETRGAQEPDRWQQRRRYDRDQHHRHQSQGLE